MFPESDLLNDLKAGSLHPFSPANVTRVMVDHPHLLGCCGWTPRIPRIDCLIHCILCMHFVHSRSDPLTLQGNRMEEWVSCKRKTAGEQTRGLSVGMASVGQRNGIGRWWLWRLDSPIFRSHARLPCNQYYHYHCPTVIRHRSSALEMEPSMDRK